MAAQLKSTMGPGMTDHLHLVNQLAHHDAAIGALGSRMSGVESALSHVQDKVSDLDGKVSEGFGSLESLIRENKASQGPGIYDLMKGVATGGAIVAMSAAAITMLVTSFVAPELTSLKERTGVLSTDLTHRAEGDRQELLSLRNQQRDLIDNKLLDLNRMIVDLQGRIGWVTKVEPSK